MGLFMYSASNGYKIAYHIISRLGAAAGQKGVVLGAQKFNFLQVAKFAW